MLFNTVSRSVPKAFKCGVVGCNRLAADNYCIVHSDRCDECGTEQERGTLLAARAFRGAVAGGALWCDECVRAACKGDGERFVSRCYCGGSHGAVRS